MTKFIFPKWATFGRQARGGDAAEIAEKRRAPRTRLSTPVLVYGRAGEEPFSEITNTIDVSARGGLLQVTSQLTVSQKLMVTNLQTNEDAMCSVVRTIESWGGKTLAGIEFVRDLPKFWDIRRADPAQAGGKREF